jgi:chemotaxis family two-component system response regulator Rcp1
VSMARSPFDPPRPFHYVDIFLPDAHSRVLKILLVEDDEPDIYLINRALEGNPRVGEVVVAEDGLKALEMIDKGWVRPDLAIVDLHMPRKDGFALLRDFAAKNRRQFPSVILTSSAAAADAHRAMHCGAVAFITKPGTPAKLSAALDRAIYNAT